MDLPLYWNDHIYAIYGNETTKNVALVAAMFLEILILPNVKQLRWSKEAKNGNSFSLICLGLKTLCKDKGFSTFLLLKKVVEGLPKKKVAGGIILTTQPPKTWAKPSLYMHTFQMIYFS